MDSNNGNSETNGKRKPVKVLKFQDLSLIKIGDDEFIKEIRVNENENNNGKRVHNLNGFDSLKFIHRINDHVRIFLRFLIDTDDKDHFIKMVNSRTEILVQYNANGKEEILFRGVVIDIQVKLKSGRDYYLEIKGASFTYDMDIETKKRSYPAYSMKYTDIIKKEMLIEYQNGDFIPVDVENILVGSFLLQYQETDWKFLVRMASRLYTGLVSDTRASYPRFWFGVPKDQNSNDIVCIEPNTKVNGILYQINSAGKNTFTYKNYRDYDITHHELQTSHILGIGDQVHFGKLNDNQDRVENDPNLFYVSQLFGAMKKGEDMVWKYNLTSEYGLKRRPFFNRNINGLSLEGMVLDREYDTAQVYLNIDKFYKKAIQEQTIKENSVNREEVRKKSAYFPYMTSYAAELHTGWYCMPEIGDFVHVYFPTSDEGEAIISQSIRKQDGESPQQPNLKVNDPKIKYFRTRYGKEVKFSPNELVITIEQYDDKKKKVINTKVVVLQLNDSDGVTISTQKNISLIAKNEFSITAKGKISIAAEQQLSIACKESNILMTGGITHIKGKKVKTN